MAPIGMLVLLILDPMGGSHLVSAAEFIAAMPDACDDFHYHPANHSYVTALDGTVIFDPDPDACGFGIVSSLPVHEVFDAGLATDSDLDGLPDIDENALGLDPNDPDSDDDGILDGDEDSDVGGPDGLSNNRELYEFQTDPTDGDTDDDGILDGEDVALRWQDRTFTFVPTYVGAFRSAGIGVDDMKQVVGDVNFVLAKGLNVRLVAQWYGVDVDAGDADANGILTNSELRASQAYYGQSFDMWHQNGLYVGFGGPDFLSELGGVDGASQLGNPSIFGEWRTDLSLSARIEFSANLFAHELAHDFGATHPAPGSVDDDPRNVLQTLDLRWPYVAAHGLDDSYYPRSQLARTQALKPFRFYGRVIDFDGAVATPRSYQIGRVSDDFGDALGGGLFDLDQVGMESAVGEDRIKTVVTLNSPVTMGDSAAIRFFVDRDDDTATGFSGPGGAVGIDIELTIRLDYSGGALRTWSEFTDNSTFETSPSAPVIAVPLFFNFAAPGVSAPVATGVFLALSKQALGLAAEQVPIWVETEPLLTPFDARDTASFVLDLAAYQADPVLTAAPAAGGGAAATTGPGGSYDFDVSGLAPSTAFDLLVDEAPVLSDTTDGSGGYSGSFDVPAGLAGGNHFVTAIDANRSFGATMIRTVPEPGGAAPGVLALAALGGLGLRRRG